MKTLGEILAGIKDGEDISYDDLYYSVLALEALSTFDSMGIRRLTEETSKFSTPERLMEESWNRWKIALGKNPKDWVGWSNDPHNDDYQKTHKFHKKLAEKVLSMGVKDE